jgi:hypothetical protein
MALIRCGNCGHFDYDHYKGKCFAINESVDGKVIGPCKCTKAKWVIQEK